jgi:hypothetical protein
LNWEVKFLRQLRRLVYRHIRPVSSRSKAPLVWAGGLLVMLAVLAVLVARLPGGGADSEARLGPLTVLEENPRYFTDGSGKAILLTGAHTWSNLQDGAFGAPPTGTTDPPPPFDFEGHLDELVALNHNFIRLWRWELTEYGQDGGPPRYTQPHPWQRIGPGTALDGKPRFDLTRFDEEYFDRLRSRVVAAGERGIYVSIMLFEGWGLQFAEPGRWKGHPFNAENNVNGIDGDLNGNGSGTEVHTLSSRAVTAIQEAYVRKVIDTVNDLDNVLYEIANESGPYSTDWQYHMIELVKSYENAKPNQHPVGMTFQWIGGVNETLFESPADWISPRKGYQDDMPPATGDKVVILDNDHLWGHRRGDGTWVWKSFTRGLNVIFMDPLDSHPMRVDARRAMGDARRYAEKMDLAASAPRGELSSTGYALANPGFEYLAFQPKEGPFTVDLCHATGRLAVEWLDPRTGAVTTYPPVEGGRKVTFEPPHQGRAILYLKNTEPGSPRQECGPA